MRKGFDYPGVTICYLCHDGEENYLFAKRSEECRDEHGRWDCGAGGLDFGLTVEGTIEKEIKEEYSTNALAYEFLGYRDVHREHKGEPTHWISLDFLVLVERKLVAIGEPHKFTDIGWFRIDDLPSPIHSAFPLFLEQYNKRL